ncbi:MAG: cupredoxin domain-containing protein [Acidimicrobiales bacterium]
MNRARAALAGAVVLALLTACGEPRPSSPTPDDLRAIDLSPDHTITVDDDGFSPASLEIEPGEVVLLVNDGTDLHSFTAPEHFDTGRLEPGEDTTLLLTDPAEITYRDLESDHEGTLTIRTPDG